MNNISSLVFSTVVEGGFCIGCGACAAFDSGISMGLDESGRYVARLNTFAPSRSDLSSKVCPFADGNPDEDQIAEDVFGDIKSYDKRIGRYINNYVGHVAEGDFRSSGSSGGLATWLSVELLKRGLVDAVVHVGQTEDRTGNIIFGYSISRTIPEIRNRAKTRYYPVEMSGVIPQLLSNPGRYLIVGVPCFIKAVRLACLQSEQLRRSVAFTIGIVCGHLKSSAFAEMLAWQCEVEPGHLRNIDFRAKMEGLPASHYGVTVESENDGAVIRKTRSVPTMYGTNWGLGFFKYKACDFCDDVVAETADISVGDAWLPEYASDSGGTSVVIVRSLLLDSILREGIDEGRLKLGTMSPDRAADSQEAGLRHRREGLAYRLWLEDQLGNWRPKKRIQANNGHLDPRQKKIFELRARMADSSHEAFRLAKESGNFSDFIESMRPLTAAYNALYAPTFYIRIKNKFIKFIKILISRRRKLL